MSLILIFDTRRAPGYLHVRCARVMVCHYSRALRGLMEDKREDLLQPPPAPHSAPGHLCKDKLGVWPLYEGVAPWQYADAKPMETH
jgi:hypothetical protein